MRISGVRRKCLCGMLLTFVALSGIAGCRAPSSTLGPDGQIVSEPPSRRFSLRPRFVNREPRRLYLNGYAGLSYPPSPGARAMTAP